MAAEKKVVTLDVLGAAVNKIKEDFPTKTNVTEQINAAALGGGLSYASEEDVLALFNDIPAQENA